MSSTRARKRHVADNGPRLPAILILLSIGTVGLANETAAEKTVTFNIPQQRADRALNEFAEQADLTLVYPPELVGDLQANELIGTYSPEEGARILLAGTGLTPMFSNQGVLSIRPD